MILRPTPVVDPVIRRAASVRADRIVVRVMLDVVEEDVSFNHILGRQRIKDANTVTTIPPNVIQLNDVCDYG